VCSGGAKINDPASRRKGTQCDARNSKAHKEFALPTEGAEKPVKALQHGEKTKCCDDCPKCGETDDEKAEYDERSNYRDNTDDPRLGRDIYLRIRECLHERALTLEVCGCCRDESHATATSPQQSA